MANNHKYVLKKINSNPVEYYWGTNFSTGEIYTTTNIANAVQFDEPRELDNFECEEVEI